MALGVLLFTGAALLNIIYGLPHLLACIGLRPVRTTMVVFALSTLYSFCVWFGTGSDRALTYLAVCVSLMPYPAYWLASYLAWIGSTGEDRTSAYEIRLELSERFGGRSPGPRMWYPEVIYDLKRTARRRNYEAPATD
jgi:hypothetical protein